MLQESVDEASDEAARLRTDYRDALDSVRQLESLVAQSNDRGDTDRTQWADEADSLRAEIESLSCDLEKTREELDELRTANQSLTDRLHEVEQERDHAKAEVGDRPTREAFDHLRGELENAHQSLEELRQGLVSDDDQATSGVVLQVATHDDLAENVDAQNSDDVDATAHNLDATYSDLASGRSKRRNKQ